MDRQDENIRPRAATSDEEIEKALKMAKANTFITNLNQTIQEHAELSTGQQQRLSLARAFLRKPKLLILDEATANLDPVTEEEIIKEIELLKGQMTIIIVSHKNSFDVIADEILSL